MIKKIFIDNFKSLNDFTIELKPLTVIVGNNAMGKSSILQAVSFLANCTVDDFRIILERRNWSVNNIKSRVGNSIIQELHLKQRFSLEMMNYVGRWYYRRM